MPLAINESGSRLEEDLADEENGLENVLEERNLMNFWGALIALIPFG